MSKSLPDFNTHPGHSKCHDELSQEMVNEKHLQVLIVNLLEKTAARLGKEKHELRILDYGCGRGDQVAVIRKMGYQCFGIDVEAHYIEKGISYFAQTQEQFPILTITGADCKTVFPDGYFDIILSNQVFEHVRDIEIVLAEMNRVSSADAIGLHIFPSRFSLIEPHMMLPVAHWLPKGNMRFTLIYLMLLLRMGAKHFKEYSTWDRAIIFYNFSISDTYYRSARTLKSLFTRNKFFTADLVDKKLFYRDGIARKVVELPLIGLLAASLYRIFYQSYVMTARTKQAMQMWDVPQIAPDMTVLSELQKIPSHG